MLTGEAHTASSNYFCWTVLWPPSFEFSSSTLLSCTFYVGVALLSTKTFIIIFTQHILFLISLLMRRRPWLVRRDGPRDTYIDRLPLFSSIFATEQGSRLKCQVGEGTKVPV